MPSHAADPKRTTLQVHDQAGQAYDVRLEVDERATTGTLVITAQRTQRVQEHALTQIHKGRHGKVLACKAGMATVTLTVDDGTTPPQLRLVAKVFFPVLDATYTLSPSDQQRLVGWIDSLALATLA